MVELYYGSVYATPPEKYDLHWTEDALILTVSIRPPVSIKMVAST